MFATERKRLIVGALFFWGSLTAGAYAYTNSATIADLENSGEGVATIADFDVDEDGVHYTNSGGSPDILSTVQFQVTSTGNILLTTKGFVQLVTASAPVPGGSTPGEWYPCTVTSAGGGSTETFTCDLVTTATTPVAVQDVDEFRTVIAG